MEIAVAALAEHTGYTEPQASAVGAASSRLVQLAAALNVPWEPFWSNELRSGSSPLDPAADRSEDEIRSAVGAHADVALDAAVGHLIWAGVQRRINRPLDERSLRGIWNLLTSEERLDVISGAIQHVFRVSPTWAPRLTPNTPSCTGLVATQVSLPVCWPPAPVSRETCGGDSGRPQSSPLAHLRRRPSRRSTRPGIFFSLSCNACTASIPTSWIGAPSSPAWHSSPGSSSTGRTCSGRSTRR